MIFAVGQACCGRCFEAAFIEQVNWLRVGSAIAKDVVPCVDPNAYKLTGGFFEEESGVNHGGRRVI